MYMYISWSELDFMIHAVEWEDFVWIEIVWIKLAVIASRILIQIHYAHS